MSSILPIATFGGPQEPSEQPAAPPPPANDTTPPSTTGEAPEPTRETAPRVAVTSLPDAEPQSVVEAQISADTGDNVDELALARDLALSYQEEARAAAILARLETPQEDVGEVDSSDLIPVPDPRDAISRSETDAL